MINKVPHYFEFVNSNCQKIVNLLTLGELHMPDIIIYTTKICPYCIRAKNLLTSKNMSFEEIDVSDNNELREEMIKKAGGRRTVPQIFINGQHIGGFDDMNLLNQEGKLDNLLGI